RRALTPMLFEEERAFNLQGYHYLLPLAGSVTMADKQRYLLIKLFQERKESLYTEMVEASTHKQRGVRWLDVEKRCHFAVLELASLEDGKHLKPNPGSCVKLFGVF